MHEDDRWSTHDPGSLYLGWLYRALFLLPWGITVAVFHREIPWWIPLGVVSLGWCLLAGADLVRRTVGVR